MSELPVQPIEDVPVDLSMPREEAEALLLAVDALRPLLERVRAEIAPEPEPEPASAPVATLVVPDHEDALRRATWLARESLREARTALDERRPTRRAAAGVAGGGAPLRRIGREPAPDGPGPAQRQRLTAVYPRRHRRRARRHHPRPADGPPHVGRRGLLAPSPSGQPPHRRAAPAAREPRHPGEPDAAGEEILGERCEAGLTALPDERARGRRRHLPPRGRRRRPRRRGDRDRRAGGLDAARRRRRGGGRPRARRRASRSSWTAARRSRSAAWASADAAGAVRRAQGSWSRPHF